MAEQAPGGGAHTEWQGLHLTARGTRIRARRASHGHKYASCSRVRASWQGARLSP